MGELVTVLNPDLNTRLAFSSSVRSSHSSLMAYRLFMALMSRSMISGVYEMNFIFSFWILKLCPFFILILGLGMLIRWVGLEINSGTLWGMFWMFGISEILTGEARVWARRRSGRKGMWVKHRKIIKRVMCLILSKIIIPPTLRVLQIRIRKRRSRRSRCRVCGLYLEETILDTLHSII